MTDEPLDIHRANRQFERFIFEGVPQDSIPPRNHLPRQHEPPMSEGTLIGAKYVIWGEGVEYFIRATPDNPAAELRFGPELPQNFYKMQTPR